MNARVQVRQEFEQRQNRLFEKNLLVCLLHYCSRFSAEIDSEREKSKKTEEESWHSMTIPYWTKKTKKCIEWFHKSCVSSQDVCGIIDLRFISPLRELKTIVSF